MLMKSIRNKEKINIIDVREDHEVKLYGEFRLPKGFDHIKVVKLPFEELSYGCFMSTDDDLMLVCVCSQGLRAGRAA